MIEMPVNRFVTGMTSWLQIQFYLVSLLILQYDKC